MTSESTVGTSKVGGSTAEGDLSDVGASVGIVGDGVVAERLRRVIADRYRLIGPEPSSLRRANVAVLATAGPHAPLATELLSTGVDVISTSGAVQDVRELLDLDDLARSAGATLVVGAAVSPGLSGLMARHLATRLSPCEELHIAVHGTAGPACAREHHRALRGWAIGWHDDEWIERPAGSGRELCWFPEPVGARDCYRAELPDPLLLHRTFPDVDRISARTTATRRDRFTARLPMLSPPHREGGVGALRVEARGQDERGVRSTLIMGIAELLGTAAAAVAAAFVDHLMTTDVAPGVVTTADEELPTMDLLATTARSGVRLQAFTGVAITPS